MSKPPVLTEVPESFTADLPVAGRTYDELLRPGTVDCPVDTERVECPVTDEDDVRDALLRAVGDSVKEDLPVPFDAYVLLLEPTVVFILGV